MKISRDKVVSLHYELRVHGDKQTETSRDGDAVSILHGHGGVIPGLEQALEGRVAGDRFSATIEPAQGYGDYVEQAPKRVPIKHLVRPGKLSVGKSVMVNSNEGRFTGTVVKVGRFNVDLDLNHPLAGKTLDFDIEIVDVRDATTEEIEHGHAHGPGGAHHH